MGHDSELSCLYWLIHSIAGAEADLPVEDFLSSIAHV